MFQPIKIDIVDKKTSDLLDTRNLNYVPQTGKEIKAGDQMRLVVERLVKEDNSVVIYVE